MTAQAGERLLYGGAEYWMAGEPLESYLRNNKIFFVSPETSCWRGYYGTWEIRNSKLLLVGLVAYVEEPGPSSGRRRSRGGRLKEVGIDFLFPGQKEVLASWFSGEIRIPTGKLLEYVHMGYCSRLEKDNFLTFENGILKSKKVVYNTKDAGLGLPLKGPGQGLEEGLGEPAETMSDFLIRIKDEQENAQK